MRKITLAVVLLLFQSAAASAQTWPPQDNDGYPDLFIDTARVDQSLDILTQNFPKKSCALVEGSVAASGNRRLLRFDVSIVNGGDGDLVVGDPADPGNPYHDSFVYSPCHGHYHISGFTDYQLLNGSGVSVAFGHKQAFCLEDVLRKLGNLPSNGYTCGSQGITVGWADLYGKTLSGQWIDITDVPAGDYKLHVEVNAQGDFFENLDRYPNVYERTVHIPPVARGKKP